MLLKKVIQFLCSLQLTLWLLLLGLILVFFGTMAQEPLGLYFAQTRFFHSFFVDAASMLAAIKKSAQLVNIYVTPMQASEVLHAPWIPVFPGGYLIGTALLINLSAAHLKRFKFSRKKIGIFMVHIGLVLLLLGQLFTDQLAQESGMQLAEGETKNYSESDRRSELVVVDATDPEKDKVVAIPESMLANLGTLNPPDLPFTLRIKTYFPNASIATNRAPGTVHQTEFTTHGVGTRYVASQLDRTTQMDARDVPAAVVEVVGGDGVLGSWLVSGRLERLQPFSYRDREYQIGLRLARHYYPFSLTLLDFRHDKYKGTETPRNFSSQVRLQNPVTKEDREVLIYMNTPLRYQGLTFYQASFVGEDVTILQVVRNPSWLTPYVACVMVGLGLVVQFMTHLIGFIQKRIA